MPQDDPVYPDDFLDADVDDADWPKRKVGKGGDGIADIEKWAAKGSPDVAKNRAPVPSTVGSGRKMMKIRSSHVATFRVLKKHFGGKAHTDVPAPGNWRGRQNRTLWRYLVGQVVMVGGSEPAMTLWARADLLRRIDYDRLCGLEDQVAEREIHAVLRAIGARYACADASRCKKTAAIAHNLRVLKKTPGGPRGLLTRLDTFRGANAERRRVRYLMKIFHYIKSKGARDQLMDLGMVQRAIALDVRVLTVLRLAGLPVPAGVQQKASVYDEVEEAVLIGICDKIGMSGVHFDRMIYQNYEDIQQHLKRRGTDGES